MTISDLERLCRAGGVGRCREAAEAARELLEPLVDQAYIDPVGNVIGLRRCGRENAPVLLLEAHIDEIGFIVTGTENGFLRVESCGHADERVLGAQPVVAYTADGMRPGVFCSTPPHLAGEDQKRPGVRERGVDIGLRPGETLPAGTPVGFAPHFEQLIGDAVCAKALDDRAGVYAVLEALERTREQTLQADVAVLFAAGEELGCRGAGPASFALQPTAAIAVDVSFAYVPGSRAEQCGRMGQGVMIGLSPCLDHAWSQRMLRLAEQQKIAHQREVMGETTGTDADRIALVRAGVPTALLSIPLKYMHTPIECVAMCDIEATAALMAAAVAEFGGDAV